MPSGSHNSTMAKAKGSLSTSLVPFVMPLCVQCIIHGLTRALLCVPFTMKSIDFVVGT